MGTRLQAFALRRQTRNCPKAPVQIEAAADVLGAIGVEKVETAE